MFLAVSNESTRSFLRSVSSVNLLNGSVHMPKLYDIDSLAISEVNLIPASRHVRMAISANGYVFALVPRTELKDCDEHCEHTNERHACSEEACARVVRWANRTS